MSGGQWAALGGLVGLALLPTLAALVWLGFRIADLIGEVRHRIRVREAVKQGWTVPTLTADWQLLDNGAPIQGVRGIAHTPKRGIKITHWTAHAKDVQRRVEVAWLAGIERGQVAHRNEGDA